MVVPRDRSRVTQTCQTGRVTCIYIYNRDGEWIDSSLLHHYNTHCRRCGLINEEFLNLFCIRRLHIIDLSSRI